MASFTSPTIHATGDVLSVTDYNSIANNTTFLWQTPYIMAFNSVTTSLTAGTFTPVTLGGLTASGYGFSVSSNNIVTPLTGIYMASGAVEAVIGSCTATVITAIYHNGSNTLQGRAGGVSDSGIPVSGLLKCSASDTIGLWGFQNTSSGVNTSANANTTFLHVCLIGSQ